MQQCSAIKVLVAQPEEAHRHQVVNLLSTDPTIEVVGLAEDGQGAVFQALSLSPHVLLTDINLPFVDGIDATAQVRRSVPDTNVLIFTRNEGQNDLAAAIRSGAIGYALQGIEDRQLHLAVQSVAAGAAWIDPRLAHSFLSGVATGRGDKVTVLSRRETEVLALLIDGATNMEIAEKLGLSLDTIKTHMRRIMDKLDVSDRTRLAVEAIRRGLV